jgi:hypothetical protein
MSNIPKMYKSQFEFIADSINKTSYQEATSPRGKEILIKNLAEELSKTNPNFNKELFIKRCGDGSNE